jgi:hypothetical protein
MSNFHENLYVTPRRFEALRRESARLRQGSGLALGSRDSAVVSLRRSIDAYDESESAVDVGQQQQQQQQQQQHKQEDVKQNLL